MEIQHPAYVLQRGQPSRATVGAESYELDDDGLLSIDDEATAAQVMDRLAATYGVEYDDDGTIVDESVDATPADVESDEADTADESADESADAAESADTADGEGYDRADLEAMDMDELRETLEAVGGDTDEIDARKKDEVVAAILRQQADGVATEGEE